MLGKYFEPLDPGLVQYIQWTREYGLRASASEQMHIALFNLLKVGCRCMMEGAPQGACLVSRLGCSLVQLLTQAPADRYILMVAIRHAEALAKLVATEDERLEHRPVGAAFEDYIGTARRVVEELEFQVAECLSRGKPVASMDSPASATAA